MSSARVLVTPPNPALTELAARVTLLVDDDTGPACTDPGITNWWISEDAEERSMAAELCARCPLAALCDEAAQGVTFGVWAGLDRLAVKP